MATHFGHLLEILIPYVKMQNFVNEAHLLLSDNRGENPVTESTFFKWSSRFESGDEQAKPRRNGEWEKVFNEPVLETLLKNVLFQTREN